jgi:hypothetical protein
LKGDDQLSKFELSLAKDYVPKWTVVDAVRELFQNALDQQTTVPDNEMFFKYEEISQTLYIGNKSSVLNVNTLLLGASSKRNDPNTIGQFGEGYKIATLVLTRLGKKVTFYNYGVKEVWRPRFVKSKRYDTDILTFFIDKKFIWQKVPDNNLTITVENITPEEYGDIVDSNLHLQKLELVRETPFGRILLEPKFQGKVYVNGLYVCTHMPYKYGYDFKPQYINIDRDRKLADSFDLEWMSSKMWGGEEGRSTLELIKEDAADVKFISNSYANTTKFQSIADEAYQEFKNEYGEDAVPVTSQEEYESVSKKYKPVFVSPTYSSTIKSSSYYKVNEATKLRRRTPKERLEQWLNNHKQVLTKRAIKKLKAIIDDIKT